MSNDDEAKARERADSIRRRSPAFRDAFLLGYMRQAVDLSLATKDPAEARRQLALDARTVDLAQESDAIEVVNTLRAYTQQQIDDGAVEPETDR